tara:strand:- start:1183 stop:1428 length:246 start_codon:yes stop_codon:yes gene_type:complete
MLKKITFLFFILLTPTLSYSYQCTMLMSNIDSAIMKMDSNKYSSLIEAAKMLKNEGEKAHDKGNHLLSEEILNAALRLLDV